MQDEPGLIERWMDEHSFIVRKARRSAPPPQVHLSDDDECMGRRFLIDHWDVLRRLLRADEVALMELHESLELDWFHSFHEYDIDFDAVEALTFFLSVNINDVAVYSQQEHDVIGRAYFVKHAHK